MRRFLIVIAAVASATVLSSPAWAAGTHGHATHGHKSASCRASGTAASCSVGATVRRPGVIRAHATAIRNQDVTVTWSMTCKKGKSTTGSTSGSFTARTPASRKLSQPFRHASSCAVSATATLAKGGKLHAWLTSKG